MAKNARLSSKVSSLSKSKWLPNDIAAICHTPFFFVITAKSYFFSTKDTRDLRKKRIGYIFLSAIL